MINLKAKKRNFIALALTATLALTGGLSYVQSQAAGYIDFNYCNVTINVDEAGNSIWQDDNKADVTGTLYKVGSITNTGAMTSDYPDIFNVDAFSKATTAQDATDIVNSLVAHTEDTLIPDSGFTIKADKGYVTSQVSNGIYLVVLDSAQTATYDYTFSPFIIAAPENEYISSKIGADGQIETTTGTTDNWKQDLAYNAKASFERRTGGIEISKTLSRYNASQGTGSFAFKVEATYNGDKVFSNVYSMDFTAAGSQTLTVDGIYTGAAVTVTEIYTGASYSPVSSNGVTLTVPSDGTRPTASFTNDYDGRNNYGGTSVVNHFEKVENTDENGNVTYSYEYKGNNLKSDSTDQTE